MEGVNVHESFAAMLIFFFLKIYQSSG